MNARIAIVVGLSTLVALPASGGAAVFCKKRKGAVFLRDAVCKRRETQISFAQVTGAQGPAGAPGRDGQDGATGQDGAPGFNDVMVVNCPQFAATGNVDLGPVSTGGTIVAACPLPQGTWLVLGRATLSNRQTNVTAAATCRLRGPDPANVIETHGSRLPPALSNAPEDRFATTFALFGSVTIAQAGLGGALIQCESDQQVRASNTSFVAVKVQQVLNASN